MRVAALMQALTSDHAMADRVLEAQDAALARLLAQDFGGTLLKFVDQVFAMPRKPLPPVSYDFWRQFRLVEELAELRHTRPSAFRALPDAPDASAVAALDHRRE